MTLRLVAVGLVILATVGFGVGWFIVPAALPDDEEPDPDDPISVPHTFPLRPADRQNDKETPALAIDRQGRIVLAWASQIGDGEFTIFLARSNNLGETFTEPAPFRIVRSHKFTVPLGHGKTMTIGTGVQPRLAAAGDLVTLGWTEAIEGSPRVEYRVARSRDGGHTFEDPVTVHGGAAIRPGYTALALGLADTVACAWLDGRNKAQQPFASISPPAGGAFGPEGLVYTGPDGKGVCPCCDLAAARCGDSTFIAFRNAEQGRRDIMVARSGTSGFEPPVRVSSDSWEIEGCPHDGPALACSEDRLFVTWTGGHTGQRRVYVAASPLDRLEFARLPLNAPGRGEQGHPRIAVADDGELVIAWDESLSDEAPPPARHGHGHHHGLNLTGSGRAIMLSRSHDGGRTFSPPRAVAPAEGVFQVQPAVAIRDGATFLAWNEISADGKNVVFERLDAE